MSVKDTSNWHAEASLALDHYRQRHDGAKIVSSLNYGLDVLRDTLYQRVHFDVQLKVGLDSMLMPTSEQESEVSTKREIELYQITVSADAVRSGSYLQQVDDWCIQWLAQLRLADLATDETVTSRLTEYAAMDPKKRRLNFTDSLSSAMPESRQAPLVLFRLFPLAVEISTVVAFDDPLQANELRNTQINLLPEIADCQQCHGAVLEGGDVCRVCGNPLWNFQWLTSGEG